MKILGYFKEVVVNIYNNNKLRNPQIEAYMAIKEYFDKNPMGEALVVLPTGTGKSGLVSIAPYGVSNKRVLVITPGLVTKKSIVKTLHPLEDNFWLNYDVIFDPVDMPVVEEYEPDMLPSSLEKCNFVIANVQKLQEGRETSLINKVDRDFFDMIIVDEAHHAPANTWKYALEYFSSAKKLHITGTPYRGDGEELPGVRIHSTSLSEVMALKYVKWLRKATVNNKNLYFITPDDSTKKYTKDEILSLKEREWVERSVALSPECSDDVINESIKQLDALKEQSPSVPHKILAIACSIKHAEDLAEWYVKKGKRVIIVHSHMERNVLEDAFLKIEEHQCDVVVSINMLMEGYDHKYLSVLALFRPYRSLNAFAQVVGRVLRAIPDNEITDFAIDNNAVVIYHEEIGLNDMWDFFSSEVEKSKKFKIKEYSISNSEYTKREILYAGIEKDEGFVSGKDSFLANLDFNALFEQAKKDVQRDLDKTADKMRMVGLAEDEIEVAINSIKRKKTFAKKEELDSLLLSKRPEEVRKRTKEALCKKANEEAQSILAEKGIDPKASNLYHKFERFVYGLKPTDANDGILVRYIYSRLRKKYGAVKDREPEMLLESKKYIDVIVTDLRRMF